MIKEYRDCAGGFTERCDVCIVGSGAGGAVAAKELAERGFDVVLVEEGGHHTRETWTGKPAQGIKDMYRDGGATMTVGKPFISLTLGKCIGGTTTVNSCTCFRTPNHVLMKWQLELGLQGMNSKDLDPYFRKVEKEINVTELPWDVLGNPAKIIRRGAERLGLNCVPLKHNVKNCKGCGTCQFGCLDGAKQSVDVTYIPRAIKFGARIYANCKAEQLIIEDGQARGISGFVKDPAGSGEKHPFTVHARIVVLACGALITPAFLMRNGFRNRHIGRHLQIHPAGRVLALMDETVEGWKGVSQGACIDDFASEGIMLEGIFVHPSLLLAGMPGVGHHHKELAAQFPKLTAFGVMVHDSTTGRVFRGHPFLATYSINEHDAEKLKRGIAYTARIFFAAGAKKVFTSISKMPILNGPGDVEKLFKLKVKPNQIETMAFHPLGTCRMASSAADGVVNERGESFDVKNLYLADGSIVPGSLGVNPQVTIMTLSTLIAENIAAALGGKQSAKARNKRSRR